MKVEMNSSITFLIAGFILINQSVMAETLSDKAWRLKTLFTTPSERKRLDALRNAGKFNKINSQNNSTAFIREPLKVEVKGIVFRESKNPVVFVNKSNTLKTRKIEDGIVVRSLKIKKDKLKVPIRVYQKTLSMKPGQYWTETDKKIRDTYQEKALKSSDGESVISSTDKNNNGIDQ